MSLLTANTPALTTRATKAGTSPPAPRPFAEEAFNLVRALQQAVEKVVDRLPVRCQTPAQLSRELGLSPRSGWKVWRFVYEPDPLAAVAFLPGDVGLSVFVDAAKRAGVPPELERGVSLALGRLRELEKRHAGDRASFQAMTLGAGETGSTAAGTPMRRHAYIGQSGLLGVQAQTTYVLTILEQLPGGQEWRLAGLRGFIGLRRNRIDAQCTIATQGIREQTEEGSKPAPERVRQLGDPETFPLVAQFCSKPLPQVVPHTRTDGRQGFELAPGAVGSSGAVNCWVGSIHTFPRLPENEAFMAYASNVPVKRAVVDVFVRRGSQQATTPTFEAYNTQAGLAVADHPKFQIPMYVPVQMLGCGLSRVAIPHIPKAKQMAKFLFDEMAVDPTDFELLRVKVNYPPVPAYMGVRVTLASADKGPPRAMR